MKKQKLVYASSIGAIISIIYVVVVTILAENIPELKDWLKDFSGHHWVSKSIFSLLFYVAGLVSFYFLPKRLEDETVKKSLMALLITAVLGTGAILLFYIGHYLHWF